LGDAADAPFTATFDYIYLTEATLRLECALSPLSTEQMASLRSLPDECHPSDHLPVAAALSFKELLSQKTNT